MNLPSTIFHTVRSLTNSLVKKEQESNKAIQRNNTHKPVNTQLICQEGQDLPFDNAPIRFTVEDNWW